MAGPEAKGISKAAHLQGQSVPVTLRFSNGSGDPTIHDGVPNVRGLAVKFPLPDGHKTDVLGITNEAFIVRTPEEFWLSYRLTYLIRRRVSRTRTPFRVLSKAIPLSAPSWDA